MSKITHIGELTPDPRNARRHTPRNIGMIEDALHDVGFARSIVIDEDGVILAGNGTVEACGLAGIENVVEVEADGNSIVAVRRVGLTPEQKQRLSLFDNRAAELAEWNPEEVSAIADGGANLSDIFYEKELQAILRKCQGAEPPGERISEDAGTALALDYLSFGRVKLPINHRELARLEQRLAVFQEDEGTSYGFVNFLLGPDEGDEEADLQFVDGEDADGSDEE